MEKFLEHLAIPPSNIGSVLHFNKNLNISKTSKCDCITKLLTQIDHLLKKKSTYVLNLESNLFAHKWCLLFVEFILGNEHCSVNDCVAHSDDMLWYVPLVRVPTGAYAGNGTSHIQVFRRQSRNKPIIGDLYVNWEETVCLNVVLQQLDYYVSCAVCTKTPPNNIHILRKNSQRVYPSPSRRRMDAKGECEEITYPKIFFAIDNFEQVFSEVFVSEGECVCVELVAHDRYRCKEAVLFLGSIRYDILKKVYDSKNLGTWNWAHKLMLSSSKRYEFVRMKGPRGRGFAEMAIARLASCGFETPMSDSYDFRSSIEAQLPNQRRMSDTSAFSRLLFGGFKRGAMTPGPEPISLPLSASVNFSGPGIRSRRWQSDSESDDRRDFDSRSVNGEDFSVTKSLSSFGSNWSMRGIGQALQFLYDKPDAIQLNAFLTNIMLPWQLILEEMLSANPKAPIITFELDFIQNNKS